MGRIYCVHSRACTKRSRFCQIARNIRCQIIRKATGTNVIFHVSERKVQSRAPPVASITCPVVQRASLDATKAMTSATSAG